MLAFIITGKKKKTCVSYKDSIKICRGDRNLETKVHLVKAMVFSSGHVWM